MEILLSPKDQTRLAELAERTGRSESEIVQQVIGSYLDNVLDVREILDRRYDDIKSGRVKAIDGKEFFENLKRREDDLFRQQSSK